MSVAAILCLRAEACSLWTRPAALLEKVALSCANRMGKSGLGFPRIGRRDNRVTMPSQMSDCPSRGLSPHADLLRTEPLCLALAWPQKACPACCVPALAATGWLPGLPPLRSSYISVYWIQLLALSLFCRQSEAAESISSRNCNLG